MTSTTNERRDAEGTELPDVLAAPAPIGTEISVTGRWTPTGRRHGIRATAESHATRAIWNELTRDAEAQPGVLAMEVNHAIGSDAVLVHLVFADAAAATEFITSTAADRLAALRDVATPELHLVRGRTVDSHLGAAFESADIPVVTGDWISGYVRNDGRRTDPRTAVQVTATWTAASPDDLGRLRHIWQQVGTVAHEIEPGLVRFEMYQVPGRSSLIIHETFETTDELKFHLTKGTAARYKKDLDRIAAPENYYFRGAVAWMIRTYSKFMRLPATYVRRGVHLERPGGNLSDGTC